LKFKHDLGHLPISGKVAWMLGWRLAPPLAISDESRFCAKKAG